MYIGRLDKLSSTIQDAGIFSGQLILIEKRTPEGMWPVWDISWSVGAELLTNEMTGRTGKEVRNQSEDVESTVSGVIENGKCYHNVASLALF